MSSEKNSASQNAMQFNRNMGEQYFDVGIPALQRRLGEVNDQLNRGETPYMKTAFAAQRAGLTEGLSAQSDAAIAAQRRGARGNVFASLTPADIGSRLANALHGSRFTEGQASIDQALNLTNIGLGGAGAAGSGALDAAGAQLGAINFLPNYNKTYAGILGAANLAGSAYGAFSQPSPLMSGSQIGGYANVEPSPGSIGLAPGSWSW